MRGVGPGWAAGALLLATVGACGDREVAPVADDPVAVARALIDRVKGGRCGEAWELLSTTTRRSIEERARLEIQQAPYYVDAFAPHRLLCKHTILAECAPESARLEDVAEDSAVVAVMRSEARDFRIPGFSPRSHADVPHALTFTREAGRWRLDLVMGRPPDLQWDEVAIGRRTIRFRESGGKTTVWAEGVVDAPVRGVQAVATDMAAWPRHFRWIREVAALPAPEDDRRDRRARLRITSSTGVSTVGVVRMKPYAEVGSSSSCCFGMGATLDDGGGTPMGVGDLMLVAYPDGAGRTLVQLGYQIERRRAAPELASRMLSAEAVAEVFGTIERAARTY